MRFLVRFVGLLALAGAFAAAVIDGARWVVDGTFAPTSTGAAIYWLSPKALATVQTFVESRLGAWAWNDVLVRALLAPAFLALTLSALSSSSCPARRRRRSATRAGIGEGRCADGSSFVAAAEASANLLPPSAGTSSLAAVDAPRRRSRRRPRSETTAGVRSSPGILLPDQASGPSASRTSREALKDCFTIDQFDLRQRVYVTTSCGESAKLARSERTRPGMADAPASAQALRRLLPIDDEETRRAPHGARRSRRPICPVKGRAGRRRVRRLTARATPRRRAWPTCGTS